MSFSISKNKMSFTADNKSVSKELTTTTDKIVAKSTTHLLDTVLYIYFIRSGATGSTM